MRYASVLSIGAILALLVGASLARAGIARFGQARVGNLSGAGAQLLSVKGRKPLCLVAPGELEQAGYQVTSREKIWVQVLDIDDVVACRVVPKQAILTRRRTRYPASIR